MKARFFIVVLAALLVGLLLGWIISYPNKETPRPTRPSVIRLKPSANISSVLDEYFPEVSASQPESTFTKEDVPLEEPSHEELLTRRVAELEAELVASRAESEVLRAELLLCKNPDDTAFGTFLRSWDADLLTSEEERDFVGNVCTDFPVPLPEGRLYAMWLRLGEDRWRQYYNDLFASGIVQSDYQAIALYLGPDWLRGELKGEKLSLFEAVFPVP